MRAVPVRVLWWAGAPVRAVLIGLIRLYRITVGQMFLGGQCRFYPSCSSYAEGAIRELGWIRGSVLGIWRIVRCSPLSAGGVDYPPRRTARSAVWYDGVHDSQYDGIIHLPNLGQGEDSPRGVEAFPRDAVAKGGGSPC